MKRLAFVCAALAAWAWCRGSFAAVQSPLIIAPEAYQIKGAEKFEVTREKHVFDGEERPAIGFKIKHTPSAAVEITIPLGGVDMLNDLPTADYYVEQTQDGEIVCNYVSSFLARTERFWEKRIGVSEVKGPKATVHIKREVVHGAYWVNWMDMRKVESITMKIPCDSWKDDSAVQEVWISDVRLTAEDSWKGTEHDAYYRRWIKFCDNYEPDYSDSSCYLEPPKEGRLEKPLTLVMEGLEEDVGEALGEIVVYPDTYNTIEIAARELQYWVEKITGAYLPIATNEPSGTASVRIHLNSPKAAKKYAADVAWLKGGADIDGYFIHTEGNDVYIGCAVPSKMKSAAAAKLGLPPDACAIGVLRGVVAFLENNSTIIFAKPDCKYGTIYDKQKEFIIRWGEGRDRPATCGRGWLSGNDYSNLRPIDVEGGEMWLARNKTNVRLPHRISGHATLAGEFIEYFPNTDEYRVWDGEKRIPFGYYNAQVCLNGPNALQKAVDHAIKMIDRARSNNYPITSLGFWNEDNMRVCICEKCTAPIKLADGTVLTSNKKTSKGNMDWTEQIYRSTQYMLFVNQLADAIAAKRPGVKTDILAYFFQYPAPKCAVSSNVVWQLAPYHQRPNYCIPVYHPLVHGVYGNATNFLAKGGTLRLYEYHAFADMNRGYALAIPEAAAEDYRWYTDHGGQILGSEMAFSGKLSEPIEAMNAWLFSQVGWHANLEEVEKLRKYYIRRVYHEGAPVVEKYIFERVRNLLHPRRAGEAPRNISATEAEWRSYLNKITNPTAKIHFQAMMGAALKGL